MRNYINMESKSLGVFILGVSNRFRGNNLISNLIEIESNYEVVWGPDSLTEFNEIESFRNDVASRLAIGRRMTTAEMACSIGHMRVYQTFLKSHYDWALVLEDDIELDKKVKSVIKELRRFSGPTIIQLEDLRKDKLHFKFLDLEDSRNSIYRLLEGQTSTQAYFMNRSAATTAVKFSESNSIISTADWPITWRSRINFFCTHRKLVSEADGQESLISAQRDAIYSEHGSETQERSLLTRIMRRLSKEFGLDYFKLRNYKVPFHLSYSGSLSLLIRQIRFHFISIFLFQKMARKLK